MLNQESYEVKTASNSRKGWLCALVLLLAAFTISPILFRPKDRGIVFQSFVLSIITGVGTLVYEKKSRVIENVQKQIDDSELQVMAVRINNGKLGQTAQAKIEGVQEIVQLIEMQPEHMRASLAQQYGVTAYMKPNKVTLPESSRPSVVPYNPPMLPGLENEIDISWSKPAFWASSKIVFGAKGTGKTNVLAMEVAESMKYLRHGKPATVYAVDPHHSVKVEIDEETGQEVNRQWYPSLSPDAESRLFIKDAAIGLNALRVVYNEGKRRVDNELFSEGLCKIVIDEYQGFLRRLSLEQKESVITMITFIQQECRKYGVECSLGLHNLKKGKLDEGGSGISSDLLQNFNNLLVLGNGIGDSNIQWGGNINTKQLVQGLHLFNSTIDNTRAKGAVLIPHEEAPMIIAIPLFDRSQITFDIQIEPDEGTQNQVQVTAQTDTRTPIEIMHQWYLMMYQSGRTPTVADVKAQWRQIRGQDLPDETIAKLIEILKQM